MKIIYSRKDKEAALGIAAALVYDRVQDNTLPPDAAQMLQKIFMTLQDMREGLFHETNAVEDSARTNTGDDELHTQPSGVSTEGVGRIKPTSGDEG